jgi:hypothetical protein
MRGMMGDFFGGLVLGGLVRWCGGNPLPWYWDSFGSVCKKGGCLFEFDEIKYSFLLELEYCVQ